jgi:hypothetical protein
VLVTLTDQSFARWYKCASLPPTPMQGTLETTVRQYWVCWRLEAISATIIYEKQVFTPR